MAGPVGAVEAAIYAAINVSAVTSLATGGVFNRLATEGAVPPYVIFQWQGGGEDNVTPDRARNTVYTIKALDFTIEGAEAIDAAIDNILHMKPITITGWHTFWTAREQPDIALVELQPDGRPLYHAGAMYRIRFDL